MIRGRHRVLPDARFGRDFGTEHTDVRPHVAVGQFVPRLSKGVREQVRVLVEPARDRLVRRVDAQREIGGEHRRAVFAGGVMRVGDGLRRIFRDPLVRAGRAAGQLPFVAEQIVEELVAPLRRR
jgi:hypothetical protein